MSTLEAELAALYRRMRDSQKELDPDARAVLYDHLWELYDEKAPEVDK